MPITIAKVREGDSGCKEMMTSEVAEGMGIFHTMDLLTKIIYHHFTPLLINFSLSYFCFCITPGGAQEYYSWLCAKQSLPGMLRGPYRMLGIEPRLVMCKVSARPSTVVLIRL